MELLDFLKQVPLPLLILIFVILVALTIVLVYQYLKQKGLDGIRAEVYQLMLRAEHKYKESAAGKQKLEWVVQQARKLLPSWLQIFVTEVALTNIIDSWFRGVKDLLDDGKVNGSGH